jgi:hypothetical protein
MSRVVLSSPENIRQRTLLNPFDRFPDGRTRVPAARPLSPPERPESTAISRRGGVRGEGSDG